MQAAGSGKGLMEDEKNMKEPYESTIVIAAKADVAEKMESILLRAGIRIDAVCHSGEEAIACMHGRDVLFLTTYQLPDMSGNELARRAGDMCGVVMIVPQDYVESDDDYETVHIMRNPVSPEALAEAVRAMLFCAGRLQPLVQKIHKLERMLEERKIIERAKGRLMDQLKLSESDAHYRIQKRSMDMGRRIVDVAREILENGVEIVS